MFGSIDALDVVSLLLGAVLAYVIVQSIALRRSDLPTVASLLLFIGLGLILAYTASEVLHMVKAAKS